MPKQTHKHTPVLLDQVLNCLNPRPGQSYLDLTAGWGGHAQAILDITKNPAGAVLVDRDQEAADYLKKEFASSQIVASDFVAALESLTGQKKHFDLILADLGVSSPHLENASRGFSLKNSGPLDMRMDQNQALSASTVVNTYSEKQLAKILKDYGQEPKAAEIAAKITRLRPLKTTDQLAAIAASAWHGRSKIHPATRTFQAIRIAVNDELGQLEQGLNLILEVLEPGGRLAVISFHSLEDRLVKNFLADHSAGYDAELQLLTKKPLLATKTEIVSNPRARSAKLRAAAKIKTNRKDLE